MMDSRFALGLFVLCFLLVARELAAQPAPSALDTGSAGKASEKLDHLWSQIESTKHQTLPPYDDIDLIGMGLGKLRYKVEHASDYRPTKWKKLALAGRL